MRVDRIEAEEMRASDRDVGDFHVVDEPGRSVAGDRDVDERVCVKLRIGYFGAVAGIVDDYHAEARRGVAVAHDLEAAQCHVAGADRQEVALVRRLACRAVAVGIGSREIKPMIAVAPDACRCRRRREVRRDDQVRVISDRRDGARSAACRWASRANCQPRRP